MYNRKTQFFHILSLCDIVYAFFLNMHNQSMSRLCCYPLLLAEILSFISSFSDQGKDFILALARNPEFPICTVPSSVFMACCEWSGSVLIFNKPG